MTKRTTLFKSFTEIESLAQKELSALLDDLNSYDVVGIYDIDKLKCKKMIDDINNKYHINCTIADFANMVFGEVCFRVLQNKEKKGHDK